MRGNWVCCMIPNMTGILTQTNGSWTTSGSPHWGVNFMKWERYDQFWRQLFAPASIVADPHLGK